MPDYSKTDVSWTKLKCNSTPINSDPIQVSKFADAQKACDDDVNCKYATLTINGNTGNLTKYDYNCIDDKLTDPQPVHPDAQDIYTYDKGESLMTNNNWIATELKNIIGNERVDGTKCPTDKAGLDFFIKKIDHNRLTYIIDNAATYNLTSDQAGIIRNCIIDSTRYATNIKTLNGHTTHTIIKNMDQEQICASFNQINKMLYSFQHPDGNNELKNWTCFGDSIRKPLNSKQKKIYDTSKNLQGKIYEKVDRLVHGKNWDSKKIHLHKMHSVHNILNHYLKIKVEGNKDFLSIDATNNKGYYLHVDDSAGGLNVWWGPDPNTLSAQDMADAKLAYMNMASNAGKNLLKSHEVEIKEKHENAFCIFSIYTKLTAFEAARAIVGPRGALKIHLELYPHTDGLNTPNTVTSTRENFMSKSKIPKELLNDIGSVFTTGKNLQGETVDQSKLLNTLSYFGRTNPETGDFIDNHNIKLALSGK